MKEAMTISGTAVESLRTDLQRGAAMLEAWMNDPMNAEPMVASSAQSMSETDWRERVRSQARYMEDKINNEADYRQRDIANVERRLEVLEARLSSDPKPPEASR